MLYILNKTQSCQPVLVGLLLQSALTRTLLRGKLCIWNNNNLYLAVIIKLKYYKNKLIFIQTES